MATLSDKTHLCRTFPHSYLNLCSPRGNVLITLFTMERSLHLRGHSIRVENPAEERRDPCCLLLRSIQHRKVIYV